MLLCFCLPSHLAGLRLYCFNSGKGSVPGNQGNLDSGGEKTQI